MKRVLASIIGLLCISSAAWAQYPAVSATVNTIGDSIVYTYTLTNTTANDIFEFSVYAPGAAASVMTSFATSKEAWYAGISRANDDFTCVSWFLVSETSATSIAPGGSADFSFSTTARVPSTNSYTWGDTNGNWTWDDMSGWNPGNTILPVPAPVPEPSSIAALGIGLLPFGTCLVRKRRQTN